MFDRLQLVVTGGSLCVQHLEWIEHEKAPTELAGAF